ncbi:MAG TPA: hypothetical protein DDZ89_21180 [Clostridiales bacterium]|nr:hypothetical protein [Clostridiales bacterium]
MEQRDHYLDELKGLTQDLYKDYQNTLDHYYTQYVDGKMKEGMSRRQVIEGMATPDLVAKRWRLYEKMDRLKGVKKKGAWPLIKEAREQQLLAPKYYYGGIGMLLLKIITFPFVLLLIFGATLLVNPAIGTFVVSTILINKPGVIFFAMAAFAFFILYGCGRYAMKFVGYFLEDMIDRTIASANLKDFSKERYIIQVDEPKSKRLKKEESVDYIIRE